MNPKDYVTIPEIVERTGLTRQAIHYQIIRNKIPYTTIGRSFLIERKMALKIKRQNKVSSP